MNSAYSVFYRTFYSTFYRTFRLNSVILAAAFVTFLLFYFMQYLISTDNSSFRQPSVIRLVDASMPVFETELFLEIEKPQPIEVLDRPEPDSPQQEYAFNSTYSTQLVFSSPGLPGTGGIDVPLSRHMVPLVRATAPYPARALQRGVQGFVELSFTVNEQGRVVEPKVLYAEPEGYFERAALNSIRNWQYSPAMDDGVPVAVHDVRQRIVFEIAEN